MSNDTGETQYDGSSTCPRCGARRWPGEYCPSCGLAPETPPQPAGPPPGKSGMKSATVALIVAFAVLVFAVVAAAWVLGTRHSPTAAASNSTSSSGQSGAHSGSPSSTTSSSTTSSTSAPATATITQTTTQTAPNAQSTAQSVTFPAGSVDTCASNSGAQQTISDPGTRILAGHGTTCTFTDRVTAAVRSKMSNDPGTTSFSLNVWSSHLNENRPLACNVAGGLVTCAVTTSHEIIYVTSTPLS